MPMLTAPTRSGKYKNAMNVVLGSVKILPHSGEIILINRQQTPHSLVLMMLPSWVMKSLQANNKLRDHRTAQFNHEYIYSDSIHMNSFIFIFISVYHLPLRHCVRL